MICCPRRVHPCFKMNKTTERIIKVSFIVTNSMKDVRHEAKSLITNDEFHRIGFLHHFFHRKSCFAWMSTWKYLKHLRQFVRFNWCEPGHTGSSSGRSIDPTRTFNSCLASSIEQRSWASLRTFGVHWKNVSLVTLSAILSLRHDRRRSPRYHPTWHCENIRSLSKRSNSSCETVVNLADRHVVLSETIADQVASKSSELFVFVWKPRNTLFSISHCSLRHSVFRREFHSFHTGW